MTDYRNCFSCWSHWCQHHCRAVASKSSLSLWIGKHLIFIKERRQMILQNRRKHFLPRFAAQVNAVSPSVLARLTSILFLISNSATFSNSIQINIGSNNFCTNGINVFTVITWIDGDNQCWMIKIVYCIDIRSMFKK